MRVITRWLELLMGICGRSFVSCFALSALVVGGCNGGDGASVDGGVASRSDGATAVADGTGGDAYPDARIGPVRWVNAGGGNGPAPADHTATRLNDGRVLIVGGAVVQGRGTPKSLAATFLYDPLTDKFTGAGSLKAARTGHSATLLTDGRVLVVGGSKDRYEALGTVEIYDPKRGWSAGPAITGKRRGHGAVRLSDGAVMIAGGFGALESLDAIEIYEPKKNAWLQPATTLAVRRNGPAMATLNNGKVLIAGGYWWDVQAKKDHYLDTAEVYDPTSGVITTLTSKMKVGRISAVAAVMRDGRAVLVGGYCGIACSLTGDVLYNPTNDQLQHIAHPGGAPTSPAVVTLRDGRVLVVGGGAAHRPKAFAFSAARGGSWSALPLMKQGRFGHTATVLRDGSVLVVGGESTAGRGGTGPYVSQAERLYP